MTKAELNKKKLSTLVLMATLRRIYKGGKKAAIKKTKTQLVNALATKPKKTASKPKKTRVKTKRKTAVSGTKKKVTRSVGRRKFGIDVEKAKDITEINRKIKDKLLKAGSFATIEKALDESRYLYVLSFTPNWKEDLKRNLMPVRRRAKTEYCKLVPIANKKLKEKNINHVVFSKLCKR